MAGWGPWMVTFFPASSRLSRSASVLRRLFRLGRVGVADDEADHPRERRHGRPGGGVPVPRRRSRRSRARPRSGWPARPRGGSGRRPRPAASLRPARPATCTMSWKVRSLARKSGIASDVSAETTPTSDTRGKSSPLATICVPSRMSSSPAGELLQHLAELARRGHRVAVHPRDAGVGELARQLALDPLNAKAEQQQLAPTGRAVLRQRRGVLAVVAQGQLRRLVEDHRPRAVVARRASSGRRGRRRSWRSRGGSSAG